MSVSKGVASPALFYRLPPTKVLLEKEIKQSQLLTTLYTKNNISNNDDINCITSLPLDVKGRKQVFHEVKLEYPNKSGASLFFKQVFKYGKTLYGFYKVGVVNIWNNNKQTKQLRNHIFKIGNQLDNRGNDISIKLPPFTKLTEIMAQKLSSDRIEYRARNSRATGDIKRSTGFDYEQTITPELFNISRSQYQLLKRTPHDVIRLPLFALIALIFEELTPLICYVFPEITPRTCVIPPLLPKIWSSKPIKTLTTETIHMNETKLVDLSLRTAYNLEPHRVKLLARALGLTSKIVPTFLYPISYLRNQLQHHYNYLQVDNYYLCGFNSQANIWNLTNQELLLVCLERNLIFDIKQDVAQFNELIDDASKQAFEKKYFDDLRYKLLQFLIDFPNANIGYLCITHSISNRKEQTDKLVELFE